MIKILANDGISPDGQTLLEEAGYEVDTTRIPQADLPGVIGQSLLVVVLAWTTLIQIMPVPRGLLCSILQLLRLRR